jgi:PPOX class probable F420-dependent enzyme
MIDFKSDLGRKALQLLSSEYVIWLTTVSADLTPQPRPVWFIWHEDSVLIFSRPSVHKVAHIRNNPNVALHFNTDKSGDDPVVVFTGTASLDTPTPIAKDLPAYISKYASGLSNLGSNPDKFSTEYSQAIRVTVTNLRGW